MTLSSDPPVRVRLLILGGGIHGAGVLHDLASRGWKDVHLIEKGELGSGTSSRSTKLIHGGLRYLTNPGDFGLVAEALSERSLLLKLVPDLVKPIELYMPVLKQGGMPGFVLRSGLWLYDVLAGKGHRIERHRRVELSECQESAPRLDTSKFSRIYSFWDGQTDDQALVQRVAASAVKLGAGLSTGYTAEEMRPDENGWRVTVRDTAGKVREISALYVFNALGPWANTLLKKSKLQPVYQGVNSKGAHVLLPDMGHKVGCFFQSPDDGRIFFMLPWQGSTLLGTTEDPYDGNPDEVAADGNDVEYLLERCNRYLKDPIRASEVQASFAGLRWLALDTSRSLGRTSREAQIGESQSERGLLMTLYGGKLSSYRKMSESIGDRITQHFGEHRPTQTHLQESWASVEEAPQALPPLIRFGKQDS